MKPAITPQSPYLQALLECSFGLFGNANSEAEQQQILNKALAPLRIASQSSRAYVFRNFEDPELGECLGMIAETCAQGINPHIENLSNRRTPWSIMPEEMYTTLGEGKPYGGPVERSIASKPSLLKSFLEQDPPLLSIQLFPIHIDDRWWGFIGFDECETARDWDDEEILMLRTASEMIGNTLRRWQAEGELINTLDTLEQRVVERTIKYAEANAQLTWEIHERERFQTQLEKRLEIESALAAISARLLSQVGLKIAIQETLEDLGRMIRATHVLFVQYALAGSTEIEDILEWHEPEVDFTPADLTQILGADHAWFHKLLESNQSVYIYKTSELPLEAQSEKSYLEERHVHSLVFLPLFGDERIIGTLVCSNIELPGYQVAENLHALEVIASMISSLLQREILLNTLERQVAERTRELSTFLEMAVLVGETQELANILQPILSKIMEVSSCEAACVYLASEQRDELELVAQRGIPTEYQSPHIKINIDEAFCSGLIRTTPGSNIVANGQPIMQNVTDLPGFHTSQFAFLRARDKILGILSCYRVADAPFTPFQISMLNAIGEQLGVVVENFYLHQQTEALAIIQERQRLARELHDAVSQSIYSLTLFARSGKDALEEGDQRKLTASLQQIEDNSTIALKEMRLLLYQLRSPLLEQGGLTRAIESRFDLVERRLGIACSCEISDAVMLPGKVEQEVFRIISEALNNSLKHAKANQVSVSIQLEGENILTNIMDDGEGFDPASVSPGMGLDNMSERVAGFGGQLKITSNIGGGTLVRLSIPQQVLLKEGQVRP